MVHPPGGLVPAPRRRWSVTRPPIALVSLFLGIVAPFAANAETAVRGLSAQDLVTMARVSDPQGSPDGRLVAYTLRTTDLDADRGRTDLWVVAADGATPPRRLTTDPAGDASPRWAPDGRSLFFLSSRSGSSQVWRLPIDGGESAPVTDLPVGVGGFVLSPAGDRLAVTLEIFPDCGADLACTVDRLDERDASPRTGQVYDRLFVRHWDTWKDHRRAQLFVVDVAPPEGSAAGAPIHLSTGLDADVPSKPFGGMEEVAWSPDGRHLVFTARISGTTEPWSTNFDLYAVPSDGSAPPRKLTDNPAWDTQPVFSPDGTTLAYLAMKRAGFEADRFRIVLRDWSDGSERVLTESWDRSPGAPLFSPDGTKLYVTAQDTGEVPLFEIDAASGAVTELVDGGHVRAPTWAGDRLVFGRDDLTRPVDLWSRDRDGNLRQLTHVNRAALAGLDMGAYEQFSFPGWNGETVHGYVVKPAGFTPGTRYPVAFLIHGGPQGSFDNDFHYRWNPQTYAGAGYASVFVDFHGSTGYGQDFVDSIRGDWGGKPLEDLQKGLAAALDRYDFLDGDRVCALGASYGGYMINWIAGNWPDRFRCLVNHDGLFDMRSMYYSTEELWFPEWEMHGTPFTNPEAYAKHNPALHVDKWKSPMLVIHGALDYRVVETQGLAAFTALQRRGIPSQLLYFPDENHWVLKPHNSMQWHDTVLAWLDRYLGDAP